MAGTSAFPPGVDVDLQGPTGSWRQITPAPLVIRGEPAGALASEDLRMSGNAHIGGNLLVDGTITGGSGAGLSGPTLTLTGTPINTAQIVASSFSLTGANTQTMASFAGTWNTTGLPTAFLLNMTVTNCTLASRIVDVQLGGASAFRIQTAAAAPTTVASVTVFGNFFVNAPSGSGIQYFDVSTAGAGIVNVRTTIMRMHTTSFQFQMSAGSVLWCSTDSADTPVAWSADFVGRVLSFGLRIKQHLGVNVGNAFQLDGQTQTTNVQFVSITGAWNSGAVAFTGFLMNITVTAALSTSLLMNIQATGVSRFAIARDGNVTHDIAAGSGVAGFILTAAPGSHGMVLTGATYTIDVNILRITGTWNNGAVAFTAMLMNVTNTASAAGAKLMELQLGGALVFAVQKDGVLLIASTSGPGAALGTLANAPSAGDPDAWVPITHNGTAMWVPAWAL